jgi:erythromycin esterase-like protein
MRTLVCFFAAISWQAAAQQASPVRDWIAGHAIPFATPEAGHGFEDMQPLKQAIGDARIVELGEATHGTREFFQLKHRMVEFLATQMGFTIFGIEANMPEAYKLNDYVLNGKGDPAALIKGLRSWPWDTQEVLAMVKWMREFNASGKGKIQFTGFDMQTPDLAAQIVGDFIAAHDPDYAAAARNAARMALAPVAPCDEGASATGALPLSAAGKTVRLSAYIKTRDVSNATLWLTANGTSRSLAKGDLGDAAPKGTAEWKKYDFEIAVPQGASSIFFGALLSGEGAAWFDDVTAEIDGVPYRGDTIFDFRNPPASRQGSYEIGPDNQTVREGHPTLMIRHVPPTPGAVNPKDASAAWKDVVKHMELSRERYGANADTEWAIQNARVVLQGMQMQGRANEVLRDESMAANIRWILDRNPGAKMIVWAHNGHVNFGGRPGKDAPMGEWLRQAYDREMVTFGFAFNEGGFRAIELGKTFRDFTVPPAPEGSLDAMLASARVPLFALDLRRLPKSGPVAEWFALPHKSHYVGWGYSEAHAENFLPNLTAPQSFHVLLFVDKTTPSRKNGQ